MNWVSFLFHWIISPLVTSFKDEQLTELSVHGMMGRWMWLGLLDIWLCLHRLHQISWTSWAIDYLSIIHVPSGRWIELSWHWILSLSLTSLQKDQLSGRSWQWIIVPSLTSLKEDQLSKRHWNRIISSSFKCLPEDNIDWTFICIG